MSIKNAGKIYSGQETRKPGTYYIFWSDSILFAQDKRYPVSLWKWIKTDS